MQDIATKVEGSQLTAAEFNQIPSEIENTITSTGQTLTNVDVRQLVKAIAIYAAKGDFYSATGTADVIALSPVSQMQAPTAYHLGMRIRFIATADNTGPVTISVGTLGTVSLYNNEGADLGPGEITTNIEYSATYDGSAFRLFAAGSGGGAALPLFYHAWQDHKLTDASYVRADTFSWQDGEIYYTAYNELVEEKALVTEESFDVVAGLTIKYYRTPKNYKIVLADQANFVSQIYDLTGAAWYYILDEENKRFKLPRKISDELDLQKTYPVVGNGMTLGLYNDNGTYSLGANTAVLAAAYNVNACGVPVGTKISNSGAGVAGGAYGITKDPTKSGIIADLSSTKYKEVQNKKYLYFYVGNTKRKETEINIGAITEALNGKVDVDLKNANPGPEFKEASVGWGMPDYSAGIAVSTPIEASPFVAPCDGLYVVTGLLSNTNATLTINGSISAYTFYMSSTNSCKSAMTIPLSKDDICYWDKTFNAFLKTSQQFYPLKGVN